MTTVCQYLGYKIDTKSIRQRPKIMILCYQWNIAEEIRSSPTYQVGFFYAHFHAKLAHQLKTRK